MIDPEELTELEPGACPKCGGMGTYLCGPRSVLRHFVDPNWKFHTEVCGDCWGTGLVTPSWCSMDNISTIVGLSLVPVTILATLVWWWCN